MNYLSCGDSGEVDKQGVLRRYRDHLSNGKAIVGQIVGGDVEVFATGAWVYTTTGRQLLNCGDRALIMGAKHPAVIESVTRQLDTNPLATSLLLEPEVALAAEALASVTPRGLEKVHFVGSGTEAVAAAITMARAKGKSHLVNAGSARRSRHRHALHGFSSVPFGDADAMKQELARHRGRACVIVESVQWSAGVATPPAGYLRDVQGLCREYDAFFVLDDTRTGLGRLGYWCGADQEGVLPDVLLLGDALGGGVVPVAAAVATSSAFQVFDRDPYMASSNVSGCPLAMAAVRGTVEAIEKDGLVQRAACIGPQLREDLERIAKTTLGNQVREVGGVGLLIGLEFVDPGPAANFVMELVPAGVISGYSPASPHMVRLTPPAVLTADERHVLLQSFKRAARAVLERL